MIEKKINRLKNLILKIKNEINSEKINLLLEWFFEKINIEFNKKHNGIIFPKK